MLTRRRKTLTSTAGVASQDQSTDKKHKIEHSPSPIQRKRKQQKTSIPTNSVENGIRSQPAQEVNSADLIACYNALKQVLTMKYVNVIERLHLKFSAKCTQSLKTCSQEHLRETNIPMSDNIIESQTFLKTQQLPLFIHSVSMDVVQSRFPGRNTLQSLFELILCINPPSHDGYKVEHVIDMTAFTIGNIFEKFPPCWQGANTEYREFIKITKKNLILGSDEILNNRTLFSDIIHCIETVIQPPKKVMTPLVHDSFNDSLNNSLPLLTFHQFESKYSQKFSFDNQNREEKIDRLFLALSMFVQLFEIDLAMWSIINLPNPSAKISTSSKNPLVSLVLWADGELVEVNFCIKNILKLYVNYINIDFPLEHTKVIGRLVNLIYNIFELREIRPNQGVTEYPQPLPNQSQFCDSLTKIIFDTVGCNIESWLKIIKVVEHPKLKLHLITALHTKIDHKSVTLNPRTIYFTLQKVENDFGEDFNSEFGQNNNVVKIKSPKIDTFSAMKYPYLQKVSRRVANELSGKQHVELHLTALNSYISVFHIKEFQQNWKNFDQLEKQKIELMGQYKKEIESFQHDPVEPFDLKKMDMLQKKPFHVRVAKIRNQIYSLDVMTEESGITQNVNIKVNVKKYREDLKFCDMITTEMPKLKEKFESLFPRLN